MGLTRFHGQQFFIKVTRQVSICDKSKNAMISEPHTVHIILHHICLWFYEFIQILIRRANLCFMGMFVILVQLSFI